MNDQVAKLLVVVDLKLQKEAHCITMDSNAFEERKKRGKKEKKNSFKNIK